VGVRVPGLNLPKMASHQGIRTKSARGHGNGETRKGTEQCELTMMGYIVDVDGNENDELYELGAG
jgi:hypothetical protein